MTYRRFLIGGSLRRRRQQGDEESKCTHAFGEGKECAHSKDVCGQ